MWQAFIIQPEITTIDEAKTEHMIALLPVPATVRPRRPIAFIKACAAEPVLRYAMVAEEK